jgi:hypothetical protein
METAQIDQDIMEEMEQALLDRENVRDERGIGDQPKGMRFKQTTKIEHGGESIGGRTRAWRTDDGREVWLNTGELPHHLGKRGVNGERVFVMKRPATADKPPIIDHLSCKVCIQMEGKSSPFRSESNYEDHMEILHPREYQRELRDREAADRRNQTDALIALAGRTQEVTNGTKESFICDNCGKEAASRAGLLAHQRSHA